VWSISSQITLLYATSERGLDGVANAKEGAKNGFVDGQKLLFLSEVVQIRIQERAAKVLAAYSISCRS